MPHAMLAHSLGLITGLELTQELLQRLAVRPNRILRY